ncbi:tRNA (32-2'-O)-methyltransferase regulator THADA [Ostrinia nubilalis]|uniref:tRNA (32-2'-O)-methyltransferase regulator THADA n=1 Tax=Ostrinia nubilalis TaxID=29057 RepID=UPI0030824318
MAAAARARPMYGVLHCVGYFMTNCDPAVLAGDDQWRALIAELIDLCLLVNQSVACVVNNASPEGHLPMDAGGIATDDYGNTGDLRLEDGRPVTAQMVLLCAWRSVKESRPIFTDPQVSNILGTLVARMSIELEDETGLLSHEQLNRIGQHFTQLLAETKHRGAFEQAYVGFSRMLTRLWRCRSEELHLMPRMWLRDCIRVISAPQPGLSATRRSAGLPYMIMALTTTEVQVAGSPKYLPQCMTALLRLANYVPNLDVYPETSNVEQEATDAQAQNDASTLNTTTHEPSDQANASGATNQDEPHDPYVEVRTHSMNILRALFKTSALEEALGGYVGEGLMVALRGFERETWMERNSSTLLFSALMVRIFGVDRARHSDLPALRNTMTGRIFFLRYPALYDFILNKLKEANESMEHELQPALCPVLLLLGRLYPSALEGTASALRLVALLPLVAAAARSPVRAARELSARALLPLVAPDQYMAFVEALLNVISDPEIKRNYCHGVLLQLTRLLDARPDEAALEGEALACLRLRLDQTLWIVDQADGDHACYVIADEYAKMINMLLWRFPSLISDDLLSRIQSQIHKVIFAYYVPPITSGRDVCIGNFVNLYFVLLRKSRNIKTSSELISLTLSHKTYEVVLSTLNYLLILHNSLDIEDCKFQKHLSTMVYLDILAVMRRRSDYIQKLCKIFETSKYPECNQKALKVLSLEKNTQKHIVGIKMGGKRVKYITDEEIIWKLFDCIQNEHENLTHIYLKSLCGFVSTKLQQSKIFPEIVLEVLRVIHSCSTSDNSDCSRQEVAEFMTANCEKLLKMDLGSINEKERFEFKSLIFGMLVTLLEDDEQSIRYAASNVVAAVAAPAGPGSPTRVIPARAAEMLRAMLDEQPPAMLVMLALMDFKSEVCVTDDIGDECRVFDQNERYNVFLEECVWSTACADKILRTCGGEPSALEFVRRVLADQLYRPTLEAMCCANLRVFEKLLDNQRSPYRNAVENPKIEVFLKKLRGEPV